MQRTAREPSCTHIVKNISVDCDQHEPERLYQSELIAEQLAGAVQRSAGALRSSPMTGSTLDPPSSRRFQGETVG